jgi:hypothetical protein
MTAQLIETLRAAEWQIHELAHTVKNGSSTENRAEELVQTMAILITLLTGGTQIVVTREVAVPMRHR